jgi:hypothetical protein
MPGPREQLHSTCQGVQVPSAPPGTTHQQDSRSGTPCPALGPRAAILGLFVRVVDQVELAG